jgi:hypothetical protein
MNSILHEYKNSGHFLFKVEDNLKLVCNAPKNISGIYLISNPSNSDELLYIGCCGHIKNDGGLSTRSSGGGGIYGRIVNGHQFGKIKRFQSIPNQMQLEDISELKFEWFETFNSDLKHSPIYVESLLLQKYFETYAKLPKWNLKF